MGRFKNVYSFNVLDEIEAGHKVYMLDKECAVTLEVNKMYVCNALKWIARAREDHDRFEFWYVEEVEEQEVVGDD